MTISKDGTESLIQKRERPEAPVQPTGIRWVSAYSILVAIGFGQYGVAHLIEKSLLLGGTFLLLATLFSAAFYGMLKQKLWAYKLTNALYNALALIEMAKIMFGDPESEASLQLLNILFAVWILIYLKRDRVKAWFSGNMPGAEETISPQQQMEKDVSIARRNRIYVMLFWCVPILIVAGIWLSGKIAPVPELSDMQVREGVITGVSKNVPRIMPSIKLLEDNGHTVSLKVVEPWLYRPYIGKRVKVWSADHCTWFGYACSELVNQVVHRETYVLDYKNVRFFMERKRYEISNYDYFFGGVVLVLILLMFMFWHLGEKKIKSIQSEFKAGEMDVR